MARALTTGHRVGQAGWQLAEQRSTRRWLVPPRRNDWGLAVTALQVHIRLSMEASSAVPSLRALAGVTG